MKLDALFANSVTSYLKNWKIIAFSFVPFILALLIPYFTLPGYIALGGSFLRTGSLPKVGPLDVAIALLSFGASLFLISFAIVAVNIAVRSQRTGTNIRTEVLEGIEKYTLVIFAFYVIAEVLSLVAFLVGLEFNMERTLGPAIQFILFTSLFYVPAALVIDNARPVRALQASVSRLFKTWKFFIVWMAFAIFVLSVPELVLLQLLPHSLAELLMLAVNSVIVLPFLVVLQTQGFLAKYTIIR